MAKFELEGENANGRPKWLTFPCQSKHADPDDRCRVSINGQQNGVGATWSCEGADRSGPIEAPTASPSVHCRPGGTTWCHFHIQGGQFNYTSDHAGRRDGNG